MARVKGAAPIKAEAKAVLDQSNSIETKSVVVDIEAKDEEEVGNEAAVHGLSRGNPWQYYG